ncbi:MAG: hypothetical protein GXP31_01255 [Kiritimatiellaeota bacterium]|nr:hypothetical protein [Kiritimatiellota bacterium]
MLRTVPSPASVVLLAALTVSPGSRAAVPPRGRKPPKPPCLLFLAGRVQTDPPGRPNKYRLRTCLPDAQLQRKLREWGYVWTADFFSTRMTWEYLTQFNAVVALDFPNTERHRNVRDDIRQAEKLLHRYVSEGGGLMLTSHIEAGQWGLERNTEELNRFLQPYDARVLVEQVEEQDPLLCLPRPNPVSSISRLAWTGNVAPGTLTTGVKGFLYPTDFGPMCYYTHPVQVSNKWQILLKGSDTARSVVARLGAPDARNSKRPGDLRSAPPLLAVRDAGKGRLALWPMIPTATIIDGYHEFWGGGLIMDGRDPKHPSNGEKLLQNLFAWLVAPSRERFGGYAPQPQKEEKEAGLHPIAWDKLHLPDRQYPAVYRGLIGLKSTLSTGKATPEDMIAAARRAGYDFAAFSEDLTDLTPDKLAALRKACRMGSDGVFQAFAGFVYHDASGNAWQVFGNDLEWPKPTWWSDEKARVIVNNNVIFRGYQFLPVIMLYPDRAPEKPCFQGNFKGIAVQTYESGRLADDATDVYRDLQANDFKLFPVAVHFVRDPSEVRQAAEPRFAQTFVPWFDRSGVLEAFSRTSPQHRGKHVFQWPQFISSGPVIQSFRVVNFGTSDLTIPGNDRWRMHLALEADRGLKEVRILDGTSLWRRIRLNGETNWSASLDGFHDRNHHFILEAVDTVGGRVVSASRGTSVQELNVPRCTDNLNTFTTGKFKADRVFPLRGLENYIARQSGDLNYFPRIAGLKAISRPAVEQRLTQVSRFGFIRTDVVDFFYPPDATSNWNKTDLPQLAQPANTIRGSIRTTEFTPWADGTSVVLVQGRLQAVRRVPVPHGQIAVFQVPWVRDAGMVVLSPRSGNTLCALLKPRANSRRGPCRDLEYVANIGSFSGARAFVPISGNMNFAALRQENAGRPTFGLLGYLTIEDGELRENEQRAYQYLAVWSKVRDRADNTFIEDVFNTMGLRGQPAYRVKPTRGRVLDTRFALRLRAREGGFACVITQAALPMRLPVLIEGLNDRWPAGIWYRGRHRFVVPVWAMDPMHNRYAKRRQVVHRDWLQRFGVIDGVGMLQIDTAFDDKEVYIGNLLVCDNPAVFLELEETRRGRRRVMVNNPTDATVEVAVRPGPGFALLGDVSLKVTVPAGGLVKAALPDGK